MKKIYMIMALVLSALVAAPHLYASGIYARVVSFEGDVEIMSAGTPVKCTVGMSLDAGDSLRTGKRSEAIIALDARAKNIVKVGEKSHVVLRAAEDGNVELVDGEILAMLKGLEPGETFQVRTPCATCGARGTGWKTRTGAKETEALVIDGLVDVNGINEDGSPMKGGATVGKGFKLGVKKGEKPGKEKKMSAKEMADLSKETADMMNKASGGGKGGKMGRAERAGKFSDKIENKVEKSVEAREDMRDRKYLDDVRRENEPRDTHESPREIVGGKLTAR